MPNARIGRLLWFICLVVLVAAPRLATAQSETRERQAAAEAYDQGTASYVSRDFAKAAEWFETANRLSPAAPALIQATRAHQQAGHLTRAATLALRLTLEYANEQGAVQFGTSVLEQLAPRFVRIEVECTGCTLDVDGTLQESQVFFVDPGIRHVVTASFETGERKQEVEGQPGTTQQLSFEAPPPPPPSIDEPDGSKGTPTAPTPKPFGPLITWIGGGVTVLLLGGTIASYVDTKAGVPDYEKAAAERTSCLMMTMVDDDRRCAELYEIAAAKLAKGESKEKRTTVLGIATGAAAAATVVIGLLLTDWSGSGEEKSAEQGLRLSVGATADGAMLQMKGTL